MRTRLTRLRTHLAERMPTEDELLRWFAYGNRRVVALACTSLVIVIALCGEAFAVVSLAARGRLIGAAQRRLGLAVDVDDVSLGVFGVTLSGVSIRSHSSGAIRVHVGSIALDTGLLGWLSASSSSVRAIEVDELRVRADFGQADAARALEDFRAAMKRRSRDPEEEARTRRRVASATEVTLEVSDVDGRLLFARGGVLRYASRILSADFPEVELGGAPYDSALIHRLHVRVERSGDGYDIRDASVGGADVLWAKRVGEPQTGASAPGKRAPTVSLFRRLASVRSAASESGHAGVQVHDRARDASAIATRWLRPGASLAFSQVTVRTGTNEGQQTIVTGLSARVDARRGDEFHARGQGRTRDGGELRWDMSVWPSQLRGEGLVAFRKVSLALVAPFLVDIPWYRPEQSQLDGEMILHGDGPQKISVRGRVRLKDGAIYAARIAPQPVRGITVSVEGRGAFFPFNRRLEVHQAKLSLGSASTSFAGALEWTRDHYLVEANLTMPPTPCAAAVSAIPSDLLGEYAGFSLAGQMGARFELKVDSRKLDDTHLFIDVADGCQFLSVPPLADVQRFKLPFVHRVVEPDGRVFEMETGPETGNWTPIALMSPFFVHSVLAHEDGGFFGHHGFSPRSIRDALVRNLKAGRYVQGASTITMQLVKNLFLRREKTLARKVHEVLLTWWIEKALRKWESLELYLNVIEYGPSIYGVRNAARHYFGISPEQLTPAQSVFLATMLPNPKAYHGQFRRGSLSPSWSERIRRILKRMYTRGYIDQSAFEYGMAEVDTFSFQNSARPALPSGHASPLPFQSGYDEARDAWDREWERTHPEEVEEKHEDGSW